MTENQIKTIKSKVYSIKKANWDIDVPGYKVIKKEWLKSQVSRAFLPNYFPEFKKYLWIDCDAWVNSWKAVELYFKACENGKLGITQSIGPGYRITSKVKWLLGKIALIKSQNYKHAKSSGINEEIARKLAFCPTYKHWSFFVRKKFQMLGCMAKEFKKTLSKGKIFGSEGLAINIAVYHDNVDVEFLPLKCNWITSHLLPKFDEKKDTFVEPFLPNDEIGIIHLAAGIWKDKTDMRLNRDIKINIKTIEGKEIQKA